jgi:hypothetical protein
VHLQVRIERRGVVGQHHIQPVHGQVGQEVGHFTFVAHQPQVGCAQHRLEQALHHQLGQAVRNAYRQPDRFGLGGAAYQFG